MTRASTPLLDAIELGIAALFDPTYKLDNSTSRVHACNHTLCLD